MKRKSPTWLLFTYSNKIRSNSVTCIEGRDRGCGGALRSSPILAESSSSGPASEYKLRPSPFLGNAFYSFRALFKHLATSAPLFPIHLVFLDLLISPHLGVWQRLGGL